MPGIVYAAHSPLCGFADFQDVYKACNTDRIHQSNLGVPQSNANGLEDVLWERKLCLK